jgi:hypothetical protein
VRGSNTVGEIMIMWENNKTNIGREQSKGGREKKKVVRE